MSISIKKFSIQLLAWKNRASNAMVFARFYKRSETEKVNLKGFEERKDTLIGDYPL